MPQRTGFTVPAGDARLSPRMAHVLALVDGWHSFEDVAQQSALPRLEAAHLLVALLGAGFLAR